MYLRKPLYGFYADLFDCKMYEAREEDLESYSSFATFFRRTLKDGVRPIDSAMLVGFAKTKPTSFVLLLGLPGRRNRDALRRGPTWPRRVRERSRL